MDNYAIKGCAVFYRVLLQLPWHFLRDSLARFMRTHESRQRNSRRCAAHAACPLLEVGTQGRAVCPLSGGAACLSLGCCPLFGVSAFGGSTVYLSHGYVIRYFCHPCPVNN